MTTIEEQVRQAAKEHCAKFGRGYVTSEACYINGATFITPLVEAKARKEMAEDVGLKLKELIERGSYKDQGELRLDCNGDWFRGEIEQILSLYINKEGEK